MSAPVLFNILNWLRKIDKIHGKQSIAFRIEFNKFNTRVHNRWDAIANPMFSIFIYENTHNVWYKNL